MSDARSPIELAVDAGLSGQRLDRALESLLPGSGLRERRRLVESGRVLVGGRPAPAGLKLREGQQLTLLPEPAAPQSGLDLSEVRVLAGTKSYAALYKPAGLNSARLAGGGGQSLEALLPGLLPGVRALLLNRLDRLTSGIVLAALDEKAARAYAALAPKDVLKEYLAVVQGELAEELALKRRLDTDDRKRTRVLGRLDPEPAAWTLVFPERALPGGRTLLRVRIQSGARHQIRAHLAAAGLPIVGDPLYGEGDDGETLFLHHARLEFRGFAAVCDPPWLAGLASSASSANSADSAEAE